MHIYRRILKKVETSFFLFGLRGTGKSTWCREHYGQAMWVNLLDESIYQELLADPALFGLKLATLERGSWVVVDEVQRLPSLLNAVHRFIEERGLRFVLTGSSTRKLKRAGVNLLAGRAIPKYLFPFTPWELESDFDIYKTLQLGALPIVLANPDPLAALKAYVQLYLKEEIQSEALVRNLPGFARFLPIAALFNASVCNMTSMSRDAGIGRSTVSDYFSILEDTHMGFFLPGFEPELRVRERASPKWMWADPGLVRTLKKKFGPIQDEEKGTLFESWLIATVRAWNSYQNEPWHTMAYWASLEAKDIEVDLILEGETGITAVEIKASERFRPEMLKGLRTIAALKRVKHRVLVYLGSHELQTEDGIQVLPVATFLQRISEFV